MKARSEFPRLYELRIVQLNANEEDFFDKLQRSLAVHKDCIKEPAPEEPRRLRNSARGRSIWIVEGVHIASDNCIREIRDNAARNSGIHLQLRYCS